jgi:hypothetical protein
MSKTIKTEPFSFRISREVAAALKKLAKKHGSVEKALRSVLFQSEGERQAIEAERVRAAERFKVGDYALLGEHKCRVLENEGFGLLRVMLVEDQLSISAYGKDLSRHEPSRSERMDWELRGKTKQRGEEQ